MNKERYLKYLTLVEESLDGVFSGLRDCPVVLKESMRYTVTAGGKRIRPVLLLGAVDAMGGDVNKALPLADAVELIHTYSLIHDDLPCMDNDDIRRGKIANHLKFGEAVALLAGDALLTLAFELAGNAVAGGCDPRVVSVIAEYAGYAGMIGGQADELSGGEMNEERLLAIERNKTGAHAPAAARAGGFDLRGKEGLIRRVCRTVRHFVPDDGRFIRPDGEGFFQRSFVFRLSGGESACGKRVRRVR